MANLGKAVKGKSKKAATKKGSKVSAGDAALEAKMRALDEANLQRQAAQTAQRILKVWICVSRTASIYRSVRSA